MKVDYDGKLYIVHWQHEREIHPVRFQTGGCDDSIFKTKGGTTLCTIRDGVKQLGGRQIAQGTAVCSEKETYCKATGRKVSLTYALRGCGNKEFRKRVWAVYRGECR